MKSIYFIYIFLFSFIFANNIDILNLKNGDVIKGEIIENKINEYIRIELQGGSILTYEYDQIDSIEVEKVNSQSIPQNTSPIRNCYQDGYNSGQQISAGLTGLGGLGSGIFFGLIGWGVSYVIVAAGNPQPEYYEIQPLEGRCLNEYNRGYKNGALKVKKTHVNAGGAMGTLIAASIAVIALDY